MIFVLMLYEVLAIRLRTIIRVCIDFVFLRRGQIFGVWCKDWQVRKYRRARCTGEFYFPNYVGASAEYELDALFLCLSHVCATLWDFGVLVLYSFWSAAPYAVC